MTLDPQSELRIRKALILKRFSMWDAAVFCGVISRGDRINPVSAGRAASLSTGESHTPCPSCRASGLNLFSGRLNRRLHELTASYADALSVRCDHCGLSADAVEYVQAAKDWSSLPRTLDAIEGYLSRKPSPKKGQAA